MSGWRVDVAEAKGSRLRRIAAVVGISALGLLLIPPASATVTDTFSGTLNASGTSFAGHKFSVADTGSIQVTLDWDQAAANLNLFLYDPSGALVASALGTSKPETITHQAAVTGQWRVGVKAKTGSATYTATVVHSPGTAPPPATTVSFASQYGYSGPAGIYPYGLDWDPASNTIVAADVWNYRVQRFTVGGQIPSGCSDPCVISKRADWMQQGGIGSPFDVEVDPQGDYWVADQSFSRIVEFSANGTWKQSIGPGGGPGPEDNYAQGCGGGKMHWPTHLVFNPDNGDVYVSDTQCGDVYVYSHQGVFKRDFAFQLGPCCGVNLPIPRGIGRTSDGRVYVVEHRSRRVVVFNDLGVQQAVWARQADMQDPRGLDIDEARRLLYVVDGHDSQVFKFNLDTGALISKFDRAVGDSKPFDNIRFVTVDGNGNVYVGETWGYRITKIDASGNRLPWAYPSKPPPDGGFNQNNGIGIDPSDGGHLYAIDSFENRIQRWRVRNDGGTFLSCRTATNCAAFELQFGHRGTAIAGTCNLGYGRGLTFGDGFVWADGAQRIVRFGADGACLDDFGKFGSSPGTFKGNTSIRVTGDGDPTTHADTRIYTTDFNCRVQVFDFDGTLLQHMGGSCGSTTLSQMNMPRQLDVIGSRIYVADQQRHRVAVWDRNTGSVVDEIKGPFGPRNLARPEGVVYDPIGNWLYIADTGNRRLVRVRPDGSSPQVVTIGWGSSNGSLTQPRYLEVGPGNLLFVNDSRRNYALRING
jgi:DNA-binding beta-propeller fold protein YncE